MKNHTAFVCGASKGIGAAAAIELSKQGVTVILIARNQEGLQNTIKELDTSFGQEHLSIVADFSNPDILQKPMLRSFRQSRSC